MHRWAAHGMVVCVFLHMCRVFYTGSYKKPRQFNWVIGVLLLLLDAGAFVHRAICCHGISWPYWAITVGTTSAAMRRLSADKLREMLLGGHTVGEARCFASMCCMWLCLPALIILLTIVHFWRVRKDGGLSRPVWKLKPNKPEELVTIGAPAPSCPSNTLPASTDKTYGLMEVVTGKPIFETITPEEEEDSRLLLSLRILPRSDCPDGYGHRIMTDVVALPRAVGGAGQPGADPESGQSPVVLSRLAGVSESFSVLGWCHCAGVDGDCPSRQFPTSTGTPVGDHLIASWLFGSSPRLWPSTLC
jgi:hypothetical protein